MPSEKQIKAAADREWKKRQAKRHLELMEAFTYEAIARGNNGELHQRQYDAMLSMVRYAIWLCSRRAGKTFGIAARLARRSLSLPNGNRIYVALTKEQARSVTMWEPIWLPMLKKWGIPAEHDETRMVTYFENGSTVRMTGSDDVRHVETELGGALDDAVIDESQSASDSVLIPLVTRILPPALGDRRGGLLLAGTVPDVAVGLFWKTWTESSWEKRNWSMFQNPHFKDPMAVVQEHLTANPDLTIDSPSIRREYFGEFVFDENVTAYRYNRERNGYTKLSENLTNFSAGIDPGTVDRTAIVVWGWSAKSRDVWQVYEKVWPKGSHVQWSEIAAECSAITRRYGESCTFRYDAGSSKNELDTFGRDYGVRVLKAANKSDLPGQVRRFNDLLVAGRAHVLIDSKLEEDLLNTRWDPDARARAQWRWSSHWHPDVADAGRYGVQDYFDMYEPPKKVIVKTEDEREKLVIDELLQPRDEDEPWKWR